MAGVLLQDQEVRGAEFQQLAYHRILIMLFLELNAPEQVLDSINFQARFFFPIFFSLVRSSSGHVFTIIYFLIAGFDSFLPYSAHSASCQSSRLLVRLAGNCLSPRLHWSTSFDYASAERLGNVCPTFDRLVQVFGSFLAER